MASDFSFSSSGGSVELDLYPAGTDDEDLTPILMMVARSNGCAIHPANVILDPDEARALAGALVRLADEAETVPRAVEV